MITFLMHLILLALGSSVDRLMCEVHFPVKFDPQILFYRAPWQSLTIYCYEFSWLLSVPHRLQFGRCEFHSYNDAASAINEFMSVWMFLTTFCLSRWQHDNAKSSTCATSCTDEVALDSKDDSSHN